jgi:carboxyl-terminal processing protease
VQVMRGDQVLDFVITRATVHVNWVNSCMLEGDVGYISLYEFSGDCSKGFEEHFNKVIGQGAKALIVDLRDNPGGWVDSAVDIADLFLDKGEVASLRYRDGSGETYTTKAGSNPIPMVVLVNENSASASEILSGALQDHERATIVGVKTYGKGVVQYVLPVGNEGAGMQLTVAQYFTPNGNEVHHVGITPDVIVEMPEEQKSMFFEIGDLTDVQLSEAYRIALDMLGDSQVE